MRLNNLDSATLRILEWVNTTVFVLLTKRSPLVAHVGALSVTRNASIAKDVCNSCVRGFVQNSTVFGKGDLVAFCCDANDIGKPLHCGGLARSLSELEQELVLRAIVSGDGRESGCDRCGIALGELSLLRGTTSVLDLRRAVLLVWREPLGLVGRGGRRGSGPRIVRRAGLVGVGIVAPVLVPIAVVVLVVVVVAGRAGEGGSGAESGDEGLSREIKVFEYTE